MSPQQRRTELQYAVEKAFDRLYDQILDSNVQSRPGWGSHAANAKELREEVYMYKVTGSCLTSIGAERDDRIVSIYSSTCNFWTFLRVTRDLHLSTHP